MKKARNIFIIVLIGIMVIGICFNSVWNMLLLDRTNNLTASINGLLTVNKLTYNLLGQLYGKTNFIYKKVSDKISKPDFDKLLNGTVIIYNGLAEAGGVCINSDEKYYYILTVYHIVVDENSSLIPQIVAPESNMGKAVRLETIKRFLRSTINETEPNLFPEIIIVLYDYDTYKGEVIKIDPYYDLALIRIAKKEGNKIQVLPISNVPIETGDKVFVCGHPMGVYYNITEGIISNLHDFNLMVVDATMTFGSSGGGVYNQFGELIGICSELPCYFVLELEEEKAE